MRTWWLVGPLVAMLAVVGCTGSGTGTSDGAADPEEENLENADFPTAGWKTDFSTHSVPLSEFHSGGPPRDGIPPIDSPRFVDVGVEKIDDREPVVLVEAGGEARAYPIQILIWHEIVNDTIGDLKVAVTFCPLCGTSVAFDRELDGRELTLGTTGNLRFSDLVMWDRQTESWWQQFSGKALVGELTGKRLKVVPSQLIGFGEFRERFPDSKVLSRQTGHERDYGSNPYLGYDSANTSPFLLRDVDELDGRLAPKARVVAIEQGREYVAYPLNRVKEQKVVNDAVGGREVVLWWRPGVASALGAREIKNGDEIGTALVYDRIVQGRLLTFQETGTGVLRDAETGSTWDASGRANSGPLAGARLMPVVHDIPFWFAVAAFRPDARIYRA